MKRIEYRCQQTIARPVELHGIGYLTGKNVHLRFRPAPASTGIVFVRADLGPQACVRAHVDSVTGTARRTTLGQAPIQVGLVEHVLAALSGLRIDNCYIDLDAPEPPGFDGSAQALVHVLRDAGSVMLPEKRPIVSIDRPIRFTTPDASISLHPAEGNELRVSYLLDYGKDSPIPWQMCTQEIVPGSFATQIAPCRTFVTETEAAALRQQGLGTRTTTSDLLIFGRKGPIDNRTRFCNEPARHKILDILGDLSLAGCDLRGHVVAYRSGHQHNVELARLVAQHVQSMLRPMCRARAA